MKKIFVRSPYFIEVNEAGQIGSKVELFIWNKGTTEPATATYTLSKKIPSEVQTNTTYNIANYAKEFVRVINPEASNALVVEDVTNWCYVKVKRYKETTASNYTLLDTETFVGLNGYTNYIGGYNQSNEDLALPLFNTNIKRYKYNTLKKVLNLFVEAGQHIEYNNDFGYFNVPTTEDNLYRLPLANNSNQFFLNTSELFNTKVEELCEPKYEPIECRFINRYGGWDSITFFKANTQSIETTSKDFNLLPSTINYDSFSGQKRTFNQQGKQKIKCNSGWVDESYSELIQDLLLSDMVFLNQLPVIVKSQSSDIKTHLKEKNINYEIEFEYNFGLINDVI